jgi:large subunit ribosomal protein L29
VEASDGPTRDAGDGIHVTGGEEEKRDMETEKIRNLTDVELAHQERELNDQLFKLKFQMKMGQTESLKKVQGLKKDIARIKTIARERKLAANNGGKK